MSRPGRFRRYVRTPKDLALLAGIIAYKLSLPLLMRLAMPRLLRFTQWLNRRVVRPSGADPERIVRYVDAAGRLAFWSLRGNCVARSLAIYTFLNTPHTPLELRFGVRQIVSEGAITPGRRHVWVMREGEPLCETEPLHEYVLLYRFPEPVGRRVSAG